MAAAPAQAATHGDVVSVKPLASGLGVTGAAKNQLITFKGKSVSGTLANQTGTISIPKGKPPKGGWPVFSWAHGTTGIADACAPSAAKLPKGEALLPKLLKAGYVVVRADYEGLGSAGEHPYLNGPSEGRSVLDIVRAARKTNRSIGKTLLMGGHSQGGHAALWAAKLAPSYAPELKLKGTAVFAPASHIGDQASLVRNLDTPAFSPIVGLILRGADIAAPALGVESLLSDAGKAAYPETLTNCIGNLTSWSTLAANAILAPDANVQSLVDYLNANDPEDLSVKTPVLVLQGTTDTTVLPIFTTQLLSKFKQNRVPVTSKTYKGLNHGTVVSSAKPLADAASFLRKRT